MEIVRHSAIVWEPLRLLFMFKPDELVDERQIEQFLNTWMQSRERIGYCGCRQKYLHVESQSCAIVAFCQWFCETCLAELLREIEIEFHPFRVEIGIASSDKEVGITFIRLPKRIVALENGAEVTVGPFSISREPVTVGQFLLFCRDVGYKTVAEVKGSRSTFLKNSALAGFSGATRLNQPACYLSAADARAFCAWAREAPPQRR